MNLLRLTLIDANGGISFVMHGEALPALLKACATSPATVDDLLERTEPFYHGLRERVANGLVMFDERNTPGRYQAIHGALGLAIRTSRRSFASSMRRAKRACGR
jgi:hypothetical protein